MSEIRIRETQPMNKIKYVKNEGWYVMQAVKYLSVAPPKIEFIPVSGPYRTRTQAQGVSKLIAKRTAEVVNKIRIREKG